MNDEILIQSARFGDESAFRALVEKYQSQVASTVIGMLGKCAEADDVGQEVFIRFYQSMDRFRGDASVGTYLTRIAINLSLNALKRRKRKRSRFVDKAPEDACLFKADPNRGSYNEDREIIEAAIYRLDPKFRSVFVLRLVNGYSTTETAKILGLPRGTVLSRLSRAQVRLREMLSPYFGEEYG